MNKVTNLKRYLKGFYLYYLGEEEGGRNLKLTTDKHCSVILVVSEAGDVIVRAKEVHGFHTELVGYRQNQLTLL